MDGTSALHLAIQFGNNEVAKLIISKSENAFVNPKNAFGRTPLHYAAQDGNIEICKLILENIEDKCPRDSHRYIVICKSQYRPFLF